MTEAPQTGLSHPLVVAYLGDLERALASADPQERLDTVTAVTEHLTDALGDDAEPTTEQVQAVLDELGSVEKIADAATPASPAWTPSAQAASADEQPRGIWTAPALLATAIVSLFIPGVGALLAIGCLVAAISLLRRDAPRRGLLRATVAVSVATLVLTALVALLLAGTLVFRTSVSTTTDSGVTVSTEAVMPTTGP